MHFFLPYNQDIFLMLAIGVCFAIISMHLQTWIKAVKDALPGIKTSIPGSIRDTTWLLIHVRITLSLKHNRGECKVNGTCLNHCQSECRASYSKDQSGHHTLCRTGRLLVAYTCDIREVSVASSPCICDRPSNRCSRHQSSVIVEGSDTC